MSPETPLLELESPVRAAAAHPVWDLAEADPLLYDRFAAEIPGARERLAALRRELPAACRIEPFDSGGFVRPRRHLRAFYQRVLRGVLAVKGTEIQADDLAATLAGLGAFRVDYPSRGRSVFSLLEHFPLVEQKVPLAVSLPEALEDATSALAVQAAHLRSFGELARVPLPLLVLRWPEERVSAFRQILLPRLGRRAAAVIEPVLASGLGCFVYHYPEVPLRVAHLDGLLAGAGPFAGYRDRLRALSGICDPEATIEGWLDLAARLLALGFLPGSLESIGIGHCLEAKNAVLGGGFVDLGSIRPISEIADPRELRETFLAAVADLAKTVRDLLLGQLVDAEAEYRNPSLSMTLLVCRISEGLRLRISALADRVQDPRLLDLLASRTAFADLDQGLADLYPPVALPTRHA